MIRQVAVKKKLNNNRNKLRKKKPSQKREGDPILKRSLRKKMKMTNQKMKVLTHIIKIKSPKMNSQREWLTLVLKMPIKAKTLIALRILLIKVEEVCQ